jgi:hypothetical protein
MKKKKKLKNTNFLLVNYKDIRKIIYLISKQNLLKIKLYILKKLF